MMRKILDEVWEFLVISFATALIGVSVFFFLEPSHVSIGSISSLALILEHFIPLQMSTISLILNVVLLTVGFLFIGKGFGAKTVYTSFLLPAVIGVLERTFPEQRSLMGSEFLDMTVYIFIVNVGVALLFNHNASSGGLDIVAKLLNKYLHMDLGKAVTAAGFAVAASSALIYEPRIVILSLLGTYVCGIILDHLIFGFNLRKRVCILSDKNEEIRHFILEELHNGATVYQVEGAFHSQPHTEVMTIVDKQEYLRLLTFIEQTDPDAFVSIYNVNKIIYHPKYKTQK